MSSSITVKSLQQNIRNLLTKIKSTSTSSRVQQEVLQKQPVDEATILLGNQLATVFLSLHLSSKAEKEKREWKEIGDECLQILIHFASEGIGYGFFLELSKQLRVTWKDIQEESQEEWIHWWAQSLWICDRENREEPLLSDGILIHCLTAYLKFVCHTIETLKTTSSIKGVNMDDAINDPFFLTSIYPKCNSKTRIFFFQEAISMAFRAHGVNHGWIFLSPLFRHVVLGVNMSTDVSRMEAHTFLAYFFQELRFMSMSTRSNSTEISFMEWMIWTLQATRKWFSSLILEYNEKDSASQYQLGIVIDMATNLLEICIIFTGKGDSKTEANRMINQAISNFIDFTCGTMIPFTCQRRISFLSRQLLKVLWALSTIRSLELSESNVLELAICSLSITHENDVRTILQILQSLVINENTNPLSSLVLHTLFVVGNIYQHFIGDSMTTLINQKILDIQNDFILSYRDQVISALRNSNRWGGILKSMSSPSRKGLLKSLSSTHTPKESFVMDEFAQCEALLLNLTILFLNSSSDMNDSLFILRTLLSQYPALGRRTLSLCNYILQREIDSNRISNAICILSFLCDTVANDAICASSIWSLLSSLSENHAPVKVICMVIRLYPSLCKSNKRLYGRIITALGNFTDHPNAMIRTAAAITIHDLAKMDVIRDVSDVIGWIQKFLTDDESLITMHSVLSLHYLIIHGYLDFSMVVKVLKKQMMNIDDVLTLADLPHNVLEAIIQLLGDGSLDGDDESSGEEDKKKDSQVVISVHILSAILSLQGLARHVITMISSNGMQDSEGSSLYFLLEKIFESLLKYTFPIMGIDYDMIRLNIEGNASKPYRDLLNIMMTAFDVCSENSVENSSKFSIAIIMKKMCKFEEDVLGPATWIPISSFRKERSDLHDVIMDITTAREGTLINFLVQKIKERTLSPRRISLAINCLEELSLPSTFISFFRHCLFNSSLNGCQQSCIQTVISQLRIQRRAAAERRDFLKFATEILHRSSHLFWKELGIVAGSEFIDGVPVIFSNSTTDAVIDALPVLYEHVQLCPNSAVVINFVAALNNFIHQSKASLASVNNTQSFLEQNKDCLYSLPKQHSLEIEFHLEQDEKSQFDILYNRDIMKFSSCNRTNLKNDD